MENSATEEITETEVKAYTVSDIMKILQIGKNNAYELCNSNTFNVIKIGKLIRIPKSSFDRWLDNNY